MNHDINHAGPEPKRLNILVLDGGGVRGLSSLLILQALMAQINRSIALLDAKYSELQPHHVFQLVAGTSTGGLIALMLGKMGMTVDECITQYEHLSKVVFSKKRVRGRLSFGLARTRYSGESLRDCVQRLLRVHRLDEDLQMSHQAKDRVPCAVICREHSSSSRHSKLKHSAVPICSLPCRDNITCKVWDAARATSAAPTFFPVMRIGNRFFADGGLAHNNPSYAVYFHYRRIESKKTIKRMAAGTNQVPNYSPHGDFDCSCVRFINIGTGAKEEDIEPGKRERLKSFIPGALRQGIFLTQTLKEIAVNSEDKAVIMRQFEDLSKGLVAYERFDANHGVSNIKLDNHHALGDLRMKTELYLEEQETKDLLEEVGKSIAKEYYETQSARRPNSQPTSSPQEEPVNSHQQTLSVPAANHPVSDDSSQSTLHESALKTTMDESARQRQQVIRHQP